MGLEGQEWVDMGGWVWVDMGGWVWGGLVGWCGWVGGDRLRNGAPDEPGTAAGNLKVSFRPLVSTS